MINNFEDFTAELTDYERDMIVPMLVELLMTRIGSKNAIRNKEICRIFKAKGFDVSEARIRKCINFIRRSKEKETHVPHLIANSRGYFRATSIEQVQVYVQSLRQRKSAIEAVGDALLDDLTGLLFIA